MTRAADQHAELMDRVYRHTRHVYDATRRYYLLGRDAMLQGIERTPDINVLEVGCGTARNLIRLAAIRPHARLFGLDASALMLDTAQRNIRRAGLESRITLRRCFAERLSHRGTFFLESPFDAILFPYCLSMIPPWRESLDAAFDNLTPRGTIHIVDFWDQRDLPAPFRFTLNHWLASFHVTPRPELIQSLYEMHRRGVIQLEITPVVRRYAFIARVTKLS